MIWPTHFLKHLLAPTLLIAGIGSCAVPGGTGAQPDLDVSDLLGSSFATMPSTDWEAPGGPWWHQFRDPSLNEFVAAAQARNLDLSVAAQNVLAAEAFAQGVGGNRGPSLDVGIQASRSFTTPVANGPRNYATNFQPSASLAWQADLFGRLKNTERAAWSGVFAADQDRVALQHSLIALVIRARVALSVTERRLQLAQSVLDSRAGTLSIVQGRYDRGVQGTGAVDVRLARENQASARSAIPRLTLVKQLTTHNLQVLMGSAPGGAINSDLLAELPPLAPPPIGLPASLLDRRPDLAAAKFRAQASAANVDVALGALYPDLFLSASTGWDSARIEDLFDSDRLFGSLIGDLSVRLFGSGTLDAEIKRTKATLEADALAYRALVLNALLEVEDALASEQRLREELIEVQMQAEEAQVAEDLARDRYANGVGNLLIVLDTERRRANSQDLILVIQQAIWNARVDLHLALGGDWNTQEEQSK